ncbi:hypothetical protein JHK82_049167 [Glycine max]|nr:hypothetical protein JHK82_049167 [Glycine max]
MELFGVLRLHHETCRTPNQTVGIARRTAPESTTLLSEHFVASIALVALHESQPSAQIAHVPLRLRQPSDQLVQFAALVELPHLVGAADVQAADEDARQHHAPVDEDPLQLLAEALVHADVALVDGDGEAAEDGSDGAAVVVGAADDAEAGVVDDDGGTVGVRRRFDGGGGGAGAAKGADEGGRDDKAAEERGRLGLGLEDGLDVFEGRAGDGEGSGSVWTRSCGS